MRQLQRGFSLVELVIAMGVTTAIIGFTMSSFTTRHPSKIVIAKRAESGDVVVVKPKTELISFESSVKEQELKIAPSVGQVLSEMATQSSEQSSGKPEAKVYGPGERQTTESF